MQENPRRNSEGYIDMTPYEAQRNIAIETKAFHAFETMTHVARLAGFEVKGTILLEDKNGTVHDGAALKDKRRSNEYEKVNR